MGAAVLAGQMGCLLIIVRRLAGLGPRGLWSSDGPFVNGGFRRTCHPMGAGDAASIVSIAMMIVGFSAGATFGGNGSCMGMLGGGSGSGAGA